MDTRIKIEVPFHKKAKAKQYGAIFDKQTRCWYASENATEEQLQILTNLIYEEDEDCNNDNAYNFDSFVANNELQNSFNHFNITTPESFWKEVIETHNPLKLALAIQENGMPGNESQRTQILHILSLRRPGDYPITYDGMIECSKDFELCYPKERVLELTKQNITGSQPYQDDIRNAKITDEEKELLMFFLPIVCQ